VFEKLKKRRVNDKIVVSETRDKIRQIAAYNFKYLKNFEAKNEGFSSMNKLNALNISDKSQKGVTMYATIISSIYG
jgi:hypothetical protein